MAHYWPYLSGHKNVWRPLPFLLQVPHMPSNLLPVCFRQALLPSHNNPPPHPHPTHTHTQSATHTAFVGGWRERCRLHTTKLINSCKNGGPQSSTKGTQGCTARWADAQCCWCRRVQYLLNQWWEEGDAVVSWKSVATFFFSFQKYNMFVKVVVFWKMRWP